jgi:hypothetical protein
MSSSLLPGDIKDSSIDNGSSAYFADDNTLDFRDVMARVWRGLPQTLGFALVAMVIAAGGYLLYSPFQSVTTSTRVIFAFSGYEKGENPDRSKFNPDDLRSPSVIAEALKRLGLDTSTEMQGKVRAAVNINGIIPPNIVKERDRLRATGQTPAPYIPDEYTLTLVLPRVGGLNRLQRSSLLNEIVSVYRENFQRTYGSTPLAFGSAFATLKNADYPEYQIILDKEIGNITEYLSLLASGDLGNTANSAQDTRRTQIAQASSFRSPTTNYSFKDLLEQTQLFAQIRLTETLGIIRENGLSRNRRSALVKLDYYTRTLEDAERRAVEEERVIRELLNQSQARAQSYVLGIKSQTAQPRSETPLVDQGLIDSLIENDATNFLVRRALEAGLKVSRIKAEKAQVLSLRESINAFMKSDAADQTALQDQVKTSLAELEIAYNNLIADIRATYADFARQQYADAIRITDQINSDSMVRPLAIPTVIGLFLGGAAGIGLSLLGIYIGTRRNT